MAEMSSSERESKAGITLALVFGLTKSDIKSWGRSFGSRTPVRAISLYMLIVAAGLSSVYIAQSIRFIATGQVPAIVGATGHPTSVVFAVDLSLLVPWLALGAIWLWRRDPWGYVLAGILNLKGTVYTLALVAGSLFASSAGVPGADKELPLWGALTAGGLAASAALLRNMSTDTCERADGITAAVRSRSGRADAGGVRHPVP